MKTYLSVFLLVVVTTCLSAQDSPPLKDGKGFDSVFQNLKEDNFDGNVSGKLILADENGKTIEADLNQSQALLNIIPDPDEVYDVSRKVYTCSVNEIDFSYTTYAFANAISITISGEEYGFSLIDGGCDLVFKDLDYTYQTSTKSEQLSLLFKGNIGLTQPKNCGDPKIFIQAGSNLVFNIEKPNSEK